MTIKDGRPGGTNPTETASETRKKTGTGVSTEGRASAGPSRDFTDDDDYVEVGPDAPRWPSPPNEAQLHNRALALWHNRRRERIEADWNQLAGDFLEGRIHEIPAHHCERIEDALTQRVKHFFPHIPDFLAAWWWAEHGMRVFPQQPNKADTSHGRDSPESTAEPGARAHSR